MHPDMNTANFEILRPNIPVLADLGVFAEQYCWPDSSSALVNVRINLHKHK
jgi:hypothetical protein